MSGGYGRGRSLHAQSATPANYAGDNRAGTGGMSNVVSRPNAGGFPQQNGGVDGRRGGDGGPAFAGGRNEHRPGYGGPGGHEARDSDGNQRGGSAFDTSRGQFGGGSRQDGYGSDNRGGGSGFGDRSTPSGNRFNGDGGRDFGFNQFQPDDRAGGYETRNEPQRQNAFAGRGRNDDANFRPGGGGGQAGPRTAVGGPAKTGNGDSTDRFGGASRNAQGSRGASGGDSSDFDFGFGVGRGANDARSDDRFGSESGGDRGSPFGRRAGDNSSGGFRPPPQNGNAFGGNRSPANDSRPPPRESRGFQDSNGARGGGFHSVGGGGMRFAGGDNMPDQEFNRKPRATHVPQEDTVEELFERDREDANITELVEKMREGGIGDAVKISGVREADRVVYETFADADLPRELLENCEKSGYDRTTPIQRHSMHLVYIGYDLVGNASTGSGKTAAFLVPIIKSIMEDRQRTKSSGCPIALIISPTRELCQQTADQARKFAQGTGVTTAKLYGQISVPESLNEVRRGCEILTATTGRLKDFVQRGEVKFTNLRFLVLDEADELLKNNFMDDVRFLVNMPTFPKMANRQTLMYSATFGAEVQEVATEILKKDHAFIMIGGIEANPSIKLNFISVAKGDKMSLILEMLQNEQNEAMANGGRMRRTLVFVNTKQKTDVLAAYLSQHQINSTSIHGDREQTQRDEAMKDLISGRRSVLVGTNVVGRGIDIRALEHVINFDLPNSRDQFVHRIGRTGRIGHVGEATSFVDPNDSHDIGIAPEIVSIIRGVNQEVPQFLLEMAGESTNSSGFAGGGFAKPQSSGGGFAPVGGGSSSGGGFGGGSGFGSGSGRASGFSAPPNSGNRAAAANNDGNRY